MKLEDAAAKKAVVDRAAEARSEKERLRGVK